MPLFRDPAGPEDAGQIAEQIRALAEALAKSDTVIEEIIARMQEREEAFGGLREQMGEIEQTGYSHPDYGTREYYAGMKRLDEVQQQAEQDQAVLRKRQVEILMRATEQVEEEARARQQAAQAAKQAAAEAAAEAAAQQARIAAALAGPFAATGGLPYSPADILSSGARLRAQQAEEARRRVAEPGEMEREALAGGRASPLSARAGRSAAEAARQRYEELNAERPGRGSRAADEARRQQALAAQQLAQEERQRTLQEARSQAEYERGERAAAKALAADDRRQAQEAAAQRQRELTYVETPGAVRTTVGDIRERSSDAAARAEGSAARAILEAMHAATSPGRQDMQRQHEAGVAGGLAGQETALARARIAASYAESPEGQEAARRRAMYAQETQDAQERKARAEARAELGRFGLAMRDTRETLVRMRGALTVGGVGVGGLIGLASPTATGTFSESLQVLGAKIGSGLVPMLNQASRSVQQVTNLEEQARANTGVNLGAAALQAGMGYMATRRIAGARPGMAAGMMAGVQIAGDVLREHGGDTGKKFAPGLGTEIGVGVGMAAAPYTGGLSMALVPIGYLGDVAYNFFSTDKEKKANKLPFMSQNLSYEEFQTSTQAAGLNQDELQEQLLQEQVRNLEETNNLLKRIDENTSRNAHVEPMFRD